MGIAGLPEDGKDRMRAAVYYGKHDIRIEDVPVPVCHDDEVLIKVSISFTGWLLAIANLTAGRLQWVFHRGSDAPNSGLTRMFHKQTAFAAPIYMSGMMEVGCNSIRFAYI